MNLCFIPDNFPPQRGGISTWLNSLSEYVSRVENTYIIVERVQNDDYEDQNKPYRIERIPVPTTLSFNALISAVVWAFNLLKCLKTTKLCFEISFLKPVFQAIRFLNYKETLIFIELSSAFFKFVKKGGVDFIFCGRVFPGGTIALLARFLFGIPYSILTHGTELRQNQENSKRKSHLTSVLKNADIIFANSHFTANILLSLHLPPPKIKIVHPGVHMSIFYPDNQLDDFIRQHRLENKKILLTIANLVERKGHDMVISCLPDVIRKVPDLIYLIVGEGIYRAKLEYLVYKLTLKEYVIFAGAVPKNQIAKYYNCCDVFVMPGRQVDEDVEGFGISFIEAAACGKPIIGGRSGGTEDAIIHGKTGFLVDPSNKKELTERVVQLLTDDVLRRQMGVNGQQMVRQQFTWDKSNQQIYDAIKQMVIAKQESSCF